MVLFAVLAVLVAFQIERIEQAWRWVAALGAALGAPTILRWFWWRVTAPAELGGALAGLLTAALLMLRDYGSYEAQLVLISGASTVAMLVIMLAGPAPHAAAVERFVRQVEPLGVWPSSADPARPPATVRAVVRGLVRASAGTLALSAACVLVLWLGTRLLLG